MIYVWGLWCLESIRWTKLEFFNTLPSTMHWNLFLAITSAAEYPNFFLSPDSINKPICDILLTISHSTIIVLVKLSFYNILMWVFYCIVVISHTWRHQLAFYLGHILLGCDSMAKKLLFFISQNPGTRVDVWGTSNLLFRGVESLT